ncbi:MAG: type II toxin-antitoxin system HicA family toxin [Thaumarchaeota archaeon]|nr:type II toxin-antitoxin system HicA family toxin [Nitrososphaerota archaeon]
MQKLPILSAKDIIKILTKTGFYYSRQKGSHIVMVKFVNDKKIIVVIPNHKEIDPGTLLSIIGQSRMTKEEFLNQY